MLFEVIMPQMGESITEGTLIKWHKKKGDPVQKDEIIFEISTDKVDTEIPSPETGTLKEIKVFENETVEVGTVVALIVTEDSQEESPAAQEVQNKSQVKSIEEPPSTTQVGGESVDVIMPKMGESVMEGTIIKWHKKVGDKIERDEIIFEISTDKVDTEVPSPAEGILTEILFNENDTIEVGTTVARITSATGRMPIKQTKAEEMNRKETELKTKESVNTTAQSQPKITEGSRGQASKYYSPLVMNIAKKENVSYDELENISGTGLNNRVTKNDLLNYIEDRKSGKMKSDKKEPAQSKAEEKHAASPKKVFEEDEIRKIIPMDNIRQRIMYHMVNSRDTSVHVTAVVEVDMTKIYDFLQRNKNSFEKNESVKLTYMPFICFACIKALKEYPLLNSSIDDKNIIMKKNINLGIAVSVEPNGLIVPNIKDADEKNIRGLAKAISELSYKSRNKGLIPDDIMNGTFSITNYGVFGSLFGTPIINQPEVGILGVGTVTKKPVVIENDGIESIAIKPMMYLSLSHDHRLIDGMLGGKFLKMIKDTLENFDTNLV